MVTQANICFKKFVFCGKLGDVLQVFLLTHRSVQIECFFQQNIVWNGFVNKLVNRAYTNGFKHFGKIVFPGTDMP